MASGKIRRPRFRYARVRCYIKFLTRRSAWRAYRHGRNFGLYVWLGHTQHHFRLEL